MASDNHWSITLASATIRRPRWLAENGRFSSDPRRALRLISPEVAARRVQSYMELHGWSPEVMERFRLVPAPHPSTDSAAGSDRLAA
jgi:hypothetical protein